jgi:hypothetical protein
MKRSGIILFLVLFFLTIPSGSKALPVFRVLFDQKDSDNRLMMVDSVTMFDNYIFSSMFPGGQAFYLAFDLYNDLGDHVYTSNSVNDTNISVNGDTKAEVPINIEEISYYTMGFAFDANDELSSTSHLDKASANVQRLKLNLVSGESVKASPEEPSRAPELVSIPATVLLLGFALIGLIGFKKRLKRLLND